MHTSFEGKVALVTGAAGGIGLATAKAFALAGASVVVADHDEKLVNESAQKLRGEGHNVLAVMCDVSDEAQVAVMIDLAVKTYGRLDAAFNNAGINCAATPMAETDDEIFRKTRPTQAFQITSKIMRACKLFGLFLPRKLGHRVLDERHSFGSLDCKRLIEKKERLHGIYQARKQRNGRISNMSRVHGIR
jgi:NAD(P)-dependent dehydrogenase (short-subunit alcohol dehydrogenase family)